MATAPLGEFPAESVSDALATLDAGEGLTAQNRRMRELLALAGAEGRPARNLVELGFDAAEQQRLRHGEVVTRACGGVGYDWRRVPCGGTVWLLAAPNAATTRAAWEHQTVRLRTLGRFAGSIVHDLGNLLGAGLGLAETVRPRLSDPLEIQLIDELARGTRHAALLGRALARLLRSAPRSRTELQLPDLVDEALAVVGKYGSHRGVSMQLQAFSASPRVRVVAEEAAQTLLQVLLFCIEASTGVIRIELDERPSPPGLAAARPLALVRIVPSGMDPEVEPAVRTVLRGEPSVLRVASERGDQMIGLLQAALALASSGGELAVAGTDPFALECCWPLVPQHSH